MVGLTKKIAGLSAFNWRNIIAIKMAVWPVNMKMANLKPYLHGLTRFLQLEKSRWAIFFEFLN